MPPIGNELFQFSWSGSSYKSGSRVHHNSFTLNGLIYRIGDYVHLFPDGDSPHYIGRILDAYLQLSQGEPQANIEIKWFERRVHIEPKTTGVEESEREIFELEDSDVNPIGCISGKCTVVRANDYDEAVQRMAGYSGSWFFCRGYFLYSSNSFEPYSSTELATGEGPRPWMTKPVQLGELGPSAVQAPALQQPQQQQAVQHHRQHPPLPQQAQQALPSQSGHLVPAYQQQQQQQQQQQAPPSKYKRKYKTPPVISCLECGATTTPQWREGPLGPKTLCNACGVRYARAQKGVGSGGLAQSRRGGRRSGGGGGGGGSGGAGGGRAAAAANNAGQYAPHIVEADGRGSDDSLSDGGASERVKPRRWKFPQPDNALDPAYEDVKPEPQIVSGGGMPQGCSGPKVRQLRPPMSRQAGVPDTLTRFAGGDATSALDLVPARADSAGPDSLSAGWLPPDHKGLERGAMMSQQPSLTSDASLPLGHPINITHASNHPSHASAAAQRTASATTAGPSSAHPPGDPTTTTSRAFSTGPSALPGGTATLVPRLFNTFHSSDRSGSVFSVKAEGAPPSILASQQAGQAGQPPPQRADTRDRTAGISDSVTGAHAPVRSQQEPVGAVAPPAPPAPAAAPPGPPTAPAAAAAAPPVTAAAAAPMTGGSPSMTGVVVSSGAPAASRGAPSPGEAQPAVGVAGDAAPVVAPAVASNAGGTDVSPELSTPAVGALAMPVTAVAPVTAAQ